MVRKLIPAGLTVPEIVGEPPEELSLSKEAMLPSIQLTARPASSSHPPPPTLHTPLPPIQWKVNGKVASLEATLLPEPLTASTV